jgi:hypothetical protein
MVVGAGTRHRQQVTGAHAGGQRHITQKYLLAAADRGGQQRDLADRVDDDAADVVFSGGRRCRVRRFEDQVGGCLLGAAITPGPGEGEPTSSMLRPPLPGGNARSHAFHAARSVWPVTCVQASWAGKAVVDAGCENRVKIGALRV